MSKKQQGLTLVELMVTLAVAIILIAVGMPMFSGIVANNRATTQTNNFLGAFKLARSEAVKRGVDVTICAIADPAANPLQCGAATDWDDNGWTVFFDDGDPMAEHLRVWPAPEGAAVITAATASVVFGADGSADAASSFALALGDATSQNDRCIEVAAAGQVRSKKFNPGAGETCP